MLIVTKLLRVVTYFKEPPPIKLHDPLTAWTTLYLHLHKTFRHQARQGDDLVRGNLIVKITSTFDPHS